MGRPCWVPTSAQLDILQRIFDGGNKCPSNAEIVQIVSRLLSHNHIFEKNVRDWFKNRHTESKRKQMCIQAENVQLKNFMYEMQPD